MFAKVFSQIFDSSIAEDFKTRHVFMDLLVLADSEGNVDMTLDAIVRRTNVPIEIVSAAIQELSAPDPESRSPDDEGRRLILMDEHRSWGWKIVNYAHYRGIRDEEGRKSYFRNYQREKRAQLSSQNVTPVNACTTLSTNAYPSASASGEKKGMQGEEGNAPFLLEPSSKRRPESEKDVIDYCKTLGLPESDGSAMWDRWAGNGYKNGGKPIVDWKATIRSWKANGHMASQKNKSEKPKEKPTGV